MTTLRRREQCLRNRAKGSFQGVACPPEAKPAPPGVAGNTVDQNRAKPCRGKLFGLYDELESERQNGNSGLNKAWGNNTQGNRRKKTMALLAKWSPPRERPPLCIVLGETREDFARPSLEQREWRRQ